MEHKTAAGGSARGHAGAAASAVAGGLTGVLLDPGGGTWPLGAILAAAGLACAGGARWAVAPLLAGLSIGLATGLLAPALDPALTPVRVIGTADLAVAASLAAVGLSARRAKAPAREGAPAGATARTLALLAAECLAAAATSAALVAAARITLRATPGEVEDVTVLAIVVATAMAVGAGALGGALRGARELAAAFGLTAACGACFAALPLVAGATSPDGLAALCDRIGRSPSDLGTLPVDALLFATTFALPSLALGAALASAPSGLRLAALLASALAGPALARLLLDLDASSIESARASLGSVAVVARGGIVAGSAALTASVAARAGRARRMSLGAAGLALALAGALAPLSPIHPRAAWRRFPVAPALVLEAPSGLYAIEPARAGVARVLRDHAPITPDAAGVAGERAQIQAWAAASPAEGAPPARTVVLGIATPARARALADVGVERFDRTGVPGAVGRLLEEALFRDAAEGPPAGAYVDAPERIDLAFRVGARELAGPGGLLANGLDRPHAVRVEASRSGAPAGLGWAIAGSDGLRSFWLERGGALAITGSDAPSGLRRLVTPLRERERAALRSLLRRAVPAPGDPLAPLQRVLVGFADLQRISSPFESSDERVEIDAHVLAGLRDHLVRRAPGSLTRLERTVAEGAADALVAQREVPWIHAYLGPIAATHGPWPRLVLALAAADDEELRPEEAEARREALRRAPR